MSSSLLAFVGLVVAACLPQLVPAMRRATATTVAGVALLLAGGALFVVG